MADGVAITAGAGTTIATDDIGGQQYQRVKVNFGQDGTTSDVSSAAPLPVTAPAADRATHSIAVAAQTDAIMSQLSALTPKFFSASVAASSTDSSLIALVAAKKLRIVALAVQCAGTATTITFESSTTTRIHKIPAGANGGQILPFNPVGWFETVAGASLTVTTGTGSTTEISGVYIEV
jgi:hypothetical protein